MEDKKMGVCLICGTEFVKARPGRKFCSRRCANLAANKNKRARSREDREKFGTDCPFNKELVCTEWKCESCGWNPEVARRRSESYGKR